MGSSKRKRDRDDKKHRRERRDRDESDGSERSKNKEHDRRKRREHDDEELLSHALHSEKEAEYISSERDTKSSADDVSMSIEETNKIRAKLGLKPLTDEKDGNNSDEFVHAPPVNIKEKETQEKYKEKIKEMREKREMHKKLQTIKKLGDNDSDNDDSASSWVKKSRKKEQQKHMAEKRAKLLEELDEEFGVSELIDDTIGKDKRYTSHDLKGLTVEHSANMIKEGKQVVLTLKDSGVLDNEDDVLVNINIVDEEKAVKNVELKKKKPTYQAYEEFDETGQQKLPGLLSQYDEEIDGEKKKSFTLNSSGNAEAPNEELKNVRNHLQSHAVSLIMPELKPANEYYTSEEMLKFKKPKKRRKIKKRENLKADDLMPLHSENRDHGSRVSRESGGRQRENHQETTKGDMMEWQMGDPDHNEIQGPEISGQEEVFDHEDDDAQLELQLALERSRRSKLKKKDIGPDKVVDTLREISEQTIKGQEDTDAIVLNSTSEFCRTLGEIPTYGSSGNRTEVNEMEEDMDLENEEQGGWEVVKQEEKKLKELDEQPHKQESNVLDDEPVLGMGVGAALEMIHKKGLIEENKVKKNKFAGGLFLPETVKIIDEEKMRDEERDRLRDRNRDRERYNPNAFKEKVGYKPDVKLEYVDRNGRHLNPKEAFRDLSHKFHGKIPGKLKTEKRVKKVSEELALKKMNAGDTPLNTVALFSEKQKQGQTPYLILSGGGQTFSSGTRIQKSK